MTGRVVSVNVAAPQSDAYRKRPGSGGATGIDKRPLSGAVDVGRLGLAGDRIVNLKHHGGPDKAVYAYASEDASWWSAQLGTEVEPGLFGENLTTIGMPLSDAVIGERWRVGAAGLVLQVTMPRTPCVVFQQRMGLPGWVKRFAAANRTGAYLRVLDGGAVRAGDDIAVLDRPAHGVTIGEVFTARDQDPVRLAALLDAPDVSAPVVTVVTMALQRAPQLR